MKKPHVFLTGLQVTVGTLCILTLLAQPSLSLQSSPLSGKNAQPVQLKLQEAEAYNNRGVEFAQQGKFTQAITEFNRAIEIYPAYENAHNNLGLALGSQDKFPEAAAAFSRALQINPKNFETYNNLGIALGSQGKFPEAVAVFNRAIQINPKDPTSHQNLGIAFWSQGKLPEAVASLQQARELYSVENNTEGVRYIDQVLQQVQSAVKNPLGRALY